MMPRTAVGGYYGGNDGFYNMSPSSMKMTAPINYMGSGQAYDPAVSRYALSPIHSRGNGRMYPTRPGMYDGYGMYNGMY